MIYFKQIYSTVYEALEHDNWNLNKYRGLEIRHVSVNRTSGRYWCEAKMGGRSTSRYFRIFVTTPDSSNSFELFIGWTIY